MPDDFEIGAVIKIVSDTDIETNRCIYNPVATYASKMVMVFSFPVKSFQCATGLEFLNITAFGKDFKIAIYGSQADSWQALADHGIDFISTGMSVHFAKFFQNDPTLTRHPKIRLFLQTHPTST
jgi:hypothetical protein